jgi:hypothetical protein
VRDSVWLAVGWMIIGLIFSFTLNKIVIFMRRRASLLQQINVLDNRPLIKDEVQVLTPPEVRVKAVLHQAKRLSRRFWLTSPEVIEANVNNLKGTVSVLDKIYDLRQKLKNGFYDNHPLVFRRADRALDRMLLRVDRSELADPELQNINLELAAFNEWLVPDKFVNAFLEEFWPDLESLVSAVNPEPSTDQAIKDLKNQLETALKATRPSNIAGVEDVYGKYARLRILWQNRGKSYLSKLIQAQSQVIDLLELADNCLWDEIKEKNFRVTLPDATEPEAYEVLTFTVKTDDPAINDSYLFCHKITYEWGFYLEPSRWSIIKVFCLCLRLSLKNPPLTPRSLGPSVAQYFPRPGEVTVEAQPIYNLENALKRAHPPDKVVNNKPTPKKLSIRLSTDFQGLKIRAWAEIISWLIAAIIAIPSGLLLWYFKQSSWGTLQDYLVLFFWAIGVDQGKNFITYLQAYSVSAANPTAGAHS